LRKHAPNGFVATLVATQRSEHVGDVLEDRGDAELARQRASQGEALGIRILLGHEDPEHPAGPERPHRQGRRERAVHATAHRDHHASTIEHLPHLRAERRADLLDRGFGIDAEQVVRTGHCSALKWRRI
jgi:hypothetical protein